MNHEKLDKMKQNKSTKIDEIIRKIHEYLSKKISKSGLLAKNCAKCVFRGRWDVQMKAHCLLEGY